jgi:uncharacterized protein YgiM (DUF1202 family)
MNLASWADTPARELQGSSRIDRRVLLKASAMVGAIAAAGGLSALLDQSRARAQNAPPAQAAEWVEADRLSETGPPDEAGFITAIADFPFTAVGANWHGEVGNWPRVELQISYDGVTYSELYTLSQTADEGPVDREGRIFTGLVCAEGARYIRYRVLDPDENLATISGFTLSYIDSSAGPSLDDFPAIGGFNLDPARPPRIISRAEWGANESYRFSESGELWPPEYRTVEHVIVHHTETSNTQNPIEAIRSIYYFHAVTRGWGDIGYNYLIDRFGNIYEGRVGGQNAVGGHSFEYAYGSSGISFIGNFQFTDITTEAQAAAVSIIAWVARGLNPLSRKSFWYRTNLPTICGHRDVNETSCPGDLAYDDLPRIRELVANVLASGSSGPPAGIVVGDLVRVDGGVNLRSGAGTGNGIVTTLNNGMVGAVYEGPRYSDGYAWYRLASDFANGWAAASFIYPDPPVPWRDGWYLANENIRMVDSARLRRVPSVNGSIVANLNAGETGRIVTGPADADGFRWYRVQMSKGTGWVAAPFFTSSGSTGGPVPSGLKVGDTVEVSDGPANLRSTPSTTGSIITVLDTGATGTLIDGPVSANGYQWFRMQTSSATGWIAGQLLSPISGSPSPSFRAGDVVKVVDGPLNLRSTPGTGSSILTVLPTGETGTVTEGPSMAQGYAWYRLNTSSGNGWAAADYLGVVDAPSGPSFAVGDTVEVWDGPLNLRSAPGSGSSIVAVLQTGATGSVLEGPSNASGYVWYRLSTSSGTGWAAADYLTRTTAPPPSSGSFSLGDPIMVTTDALNLRSSPGTSSSVLTVLYQGTAGTIAGGPQSSGGSTWYQIETSAGTGWVAGQFIGSAISVGSAIRVATDDDGPLNLRSAASTGGSVLAALPNGTTGTVLGGPERTGGYTWWRIQTSQSTGWAVGSYLRPT